MNRLLSICVLIVLFSCRTEHENVPNDLELPVISGELAWQDISDDQVKVLYFLSPECPLCQNYAVAMRDLKNKFPQINFIGIVPGNEYNKDEVRKYLIRFGLEFNTYFDPDFKLSNALGAEITPEAFLLSQDGKVLYSGAIDNWAISLGQKRTVITERYLEDAIASTLENREIKIKSTTAVGCFIQ